MNTSKGREVLGRILEEHREKLGLSKREMAKYLDVPYGTYNNYSDPEAGYTLQPDTIAQIAQKLGYSEAEFFRRAYGLDAGTESFWVEKEYFGHVYGSLQIEQRKMVMAMLSAIGGETQEEVAKLQRGIEAARGVPKLELSALQTVGRFLQDLLLGMGGSRQQAWIRLIQNSLQRAGAERPSDDLIQEVVNDIACQRVIDELSPIQSITYLEKLMYLTFYVDKQSPPWDKREDVLARWETLVQLL